MPWVRLAKILQTRPLDRETKLMLIDLLTGVNDQKLEEEIFTFVFAWEESMAQNDRALIDGVKGILARDTAARQANARLTHKALLSVTDDLIRQQKIHAIKISIEEL